MLSIKTRLQSSATTFLVRLQKVRTIELNPLSNPLLCLELIHLRTADQCFVQPASSIEAVGLQNFYPVAQYFNEYPATSGPSIDPSFPRSHQQAFRNSGTSIVVV